MSVYLHDLIDLPERVQALWGVVIKPTGKGWLREKFAEVGGLELDDRCAADWVAVCSASFGLPSVFLAGTLLAVAEKGLRRFNHELHKLSRML